MCHLANAHYFTGPGVYTQDGFFFHLAGPVAPTDIAIVHWVRY